MKKILLFSLIILLSSFQDFDVIKQKVKGWDIYEYVRPKNCQVLDTVRLSTVFDKESGMLVKDILERRVPKLKRKYPNATGLLLWNNSGYYWAAIINENTEKTPPLQ